MGLFDSVKKANKSQWAINRKPTLITLEDNHMHCISAGKEFDIFYSDIKNIEKQMRIIKLKTTVNEYTIVPRKMRGASELSEELYNDLVIRIGESKK